MVVKTVESAADFVDAATPFLLADEARNNLVLRIAWTLRDQPGVYVEHRRWLVEDRPGRVVAAALRTSPYNLVLAGPTSLVALDGLAGDELAVQQTRTENCSSTGSQRSPRRRPRRTRRTRMPSGPSRHV